MTEPMFLAGNDAGCLIVCDHASNQVPAAIDLQVDAQTMDAHVAWDIGSAALSRALARRLDCDAILATVSRLVVDCNRAPARAIPETSDGRTIAGNRHLSAAARARRLALHAQYHAAIAARIRRRRPRLLIAVHSFTPQLQSRAEARPWPVALLWNRDERATRPALAALRAEALPGPVGANQPYSGRDLNYSMNRHAEANNIPYLAVEVRQDQLQAADGAEVYAGILQRAVAAALGALAPA